MAGLCKHAIISNMVIERSYTWIKIQKRKYPLALTVTCCQAIRSLLLGLKTGNSVWKSSLTVVSGVKHHAMKIYGDWINNSMHT
jgi:hypothetical protein